MTRERIEKEKNFAREIILDALKEMLAKATDETERAELERKILKIATA